MTGVQTCALPILSSNTVGQMIYSMEGHNYYIAFEKLSIENWVLVVITPASMIAEELNLSLIHISNNSIKEIRNKIATIY